jgi:hypothetical protein
MRPWSRTPASGPRGLEHSGLAKRSLSRAGIRAVGAVTGDATRDAPY